MTSHSDFFQKTKPFEQLFERFIESIPDIQSDPAHDLLHFRRVAVTAKKLAVQENALLEVVVPAAWLHDCVPLPKNHPNRKEASRLSAIKAVQFLKEIQYPNNYHEQIFHAIEAHSFSANIEPLHLEAKIVQDADRLDGLGSIGIARLFATASLLKSSFYAEKEPFFGLDFIGAQRENKLEIRDLNDKKYAVDHFAVKLFKIVDTLHTKAGKQEGFVRAERMKKFLVDLKNEIENDFEH